MASSASEVTPYNVLRHELVGLSAKVAESADPSQKGASGVITNETRDTITLTSRGRKRTVAKKDVTLSIHTESGLKLLVNGSLFLGRPEDRIKKKVRISF